MLIELYDIRVMMKTSIVLLIFFLLIHHRASGQVTPDNDRISINVRDQPLGKVFKLIAKKTGARFSYSEKLIPVDRKISLQVKDQTLEEVLITIGKITKLSFINVRGQWVITKPEAEKDSGNIPVTEKYTISGIVRDQSDGETLIGATVYIPGASAGTITNAYGFYSLTVPEGSYDIQYSYVGYQTMDEKLDLHKNITLNEDIRNTAIIMPEVIVSPDVITDRTDLPEMGVEKIKPSVVEKMPAVLGEGDIIKSLQLLPGIKLNSDGSSYFYVRGGDRDQNLVQIDDAPVYNPSHLLGLFTTFIPDAVKDIKIYKGDFPASIGDRLSSVVDVSTHDGNMRQFALNGNLGLLSEQLSAEGPISKENSSFFISGRRSHINWIFKQLNSGISDFHFDDINAKLNFRLNQRNRIFFSFYSGTDNYAENFSGIKWDNLTGTFRWNHIFNDKLFSNTTLYGSRFNYFLNLGKDNYWTSQIANLSLKSDFSWFINPSNTFNFGFNLSGHNFNPGNYYTNGDLNPGVPYVSQRHARELALYAEEEQKLGTSWSIRYGFRLSNWENTGEAIEYKFNDTHHPVDTMVFAAGVPYHNYSGFEPRLGIRYGISDNISVKASFTHIAQYMQVISNSISPFTSLDVWLPAGPNIKPQFSNQFSMGYFQQLTGIKSEFSIEAYYRYLGNQIDYADHAKMFFNPQLESELRFGSARARGIELIFKKSAGNFSGWVSCNGSRVLKKIPELNNGEPYPPYYDRPLQVTVYFDYTISNRSGFSADWIFESGSAFTTPSSYYRYNGISVPVYLSKNNSRLPPYHRLDLSYSLRLNKKEHRYSHSLSFNIYNVYNRENPYYVNFNKILDGDGNPVIPENISGSEQKVITKRYIYNIIPSLTYKFSFK